MALQTPLFGPSAVLSTPDSVARRRALAQSLLAQGTDTSPVGSWTQGAARLADALVGGYGMRKADAMELAGRQAANQSMTDSLGSIFGGAGGQTPGGVPSGPASGPSPVSASGPSGGPTPPMPIPASTSAPVPTSTPPSDQGLPPVAGSGATPSPGPASMGTPPASPAPAMPSAAATNALTGGASLTKLLQTAQNPWLTDDQKQLLNGVIQMKMVPHYMTIKDASGNENLFNPATNQFITQADLYNQANASRGGAGATSGAAPFPPTMAQTETMKDYAAYVNQTRNAGGTPIPFNDYQMELKKQGAQSVVFKGDSAAANKVGEAIGGNMADYIDGVKDNRSKIQALNLLKGTLDQYGNNISTGPGAGHILLMKQALANYFPGAFADSAAPTEIIQKISTQLATADAKSLASRPTQFDFATYLRNNPGLLMSIAGNKALIELKLQQAQHDYELGSMATQKKYAEDPNGWADVVQQYDLTHPLINPLTHKPADANATDFPAPPGSGVVTQGSSPQAAPVTSVRTPADIASLPSGTKFVIPDGSGRIGTVP